MVVVTALVAVVAVVMALVHALNLVLAAIKMVEIVLGILVQVVQRTHALHALQTLVQVDRLALVSPNQSLAVNVATLAAAKHVSPQSSPFCMESSRFW